MDDELKLCAHCGGKASVMDTFVGHYCICEDCGNQTAVHTGIESSICAWNCRVHDELQAKYDKAMTFIDDLCRVDPVLCPYPLRAWVNDARELKDDLLRMRNE